MADEWEVVSPFEVDSPSGKMSGTITATPNEQTSDEWEVVPQAKEKEDFFSTEKAIGRKMYEGAKTAARFTLEAPERLLFGETQREFDERLNADRKRMQLEGASGYDMAKHDLAESLKSSAKGAINAATYLLPIGGVKAGTKLASFLGEGIAKKGAEIGLSALKTGGVMAAAEGLKDAIDLKSPKEIKDKMVATGLFNAATDIGLRTIAAPFKGLPKAATDIANTESVLANLEKGLETGQEYLKKSTTKAIKWSKNAISKEYGKIFDGAIGKNIVDATPVLQEIILNRPDAKNIAKKALKGKASRDLSGAIQKVENGLPATMSLKDLQKIKEGLSNSSYEAVARNEGISSLFRESADNITSLIDKNVDAYQNTMGASGLRKYRELNDSWKEISRIEDLTERDLGSIIQKKAEGRKGLTNLRENIPQAVSEIESVVKEKGDMSSDIVLDQFKKIRALKQNAIILRETGNPRNIQLGNKIDETINGLVDNLTNKENVMNAKKFTMGLVRKFPQGSPEREAAAQVARANPDLLQKSLEPDSAMLGLVGLTAGAARWLRYGAFSSPLKASIYASAIHSKGAITGDTARNFLNATRDSVAPALKKAKPVVRGAINSAFNLLYDSVNDQNENQQ